MDWIAQTYTANSAPLNASRVVNMFAELQVQDAKSKAPVAIWGHPGTAPFALCGGGPVLNYTVMGGQLYAVTADGFWQVNPDGGSVLLGTTSVNPNGCSIDNNGKTVCWVDGSSGWIWTASTGVQQISDTNFYPSNTVTYFDTYFVFVRNGTREFFLSPQNWNGTDAFDSTQFASKEATPDLLIAIVNSHEQLYLFGEKRCEVWYDAGNAPPTFPFQRSDGAIIQRGLAAPYATIVEDNTLFWLGEDLMFYRLDGFQPERLSNHAIESQWQRYDHVYNTKAFVYTIFGHKMIALTFLTARKTWVVDLSTKRWHERESWIGNNAETSIGRWRVNCAINTPSTSGNYPDVLFGDSQTGRIDRANMDVFTEFGDMMRAMVVGPPIHTDRRRVFMKRFELDVESGVGLLGGPQSVTSEYCPVGITMTSPSSIQTADALSGTAPSFSAFVFSDFVYLPDDSTTRGLVFGNSHLQITIANDASSTNQIVVTATDASGDPILDAEYQWTDWAHWTWIGISVDTATNQISCWINSTIVETALTPVVLTWSSTNPIPNDTGDPWQFYPTGA